MHTPRNVRTISLLASLLVLGACRHAAPEQSPTPASAPAEPPAGAAAPSPVPGPTAPGAPIQEYQGSYSSGWESSWFIPCNAPMDDALWWVTLTDVALHQRDSLLSKVTRAPTGALAVRWRGTASGRMPAGMMGRGTRYLLVTEIIDVQPLSPAGACLPPTRKS
jgi:hypothetical protein